MNIPQIGSSNVTMGYLGMAEGMFETLEFEQYTDEVIIKTAKNV